MIYWLLQLWDTLVNNRLHLFFFFVVYVWFVWGLKYYYSVKYRVHDSPYSAPVSAIIPVYNEDPEVFRRCLRTLRMQPEVKEVVVAVDGGSIDQVRIAEEYADKVLILERCGKRKAIVKALGETTHDLILIVDSDTTLTDGVVREMLRPFADPKVGGVESRQKIRQQNHNLVSRLSGWIEDFRFSMSAPAQSYFGAVGCLCGRAILIRRRILLKNAERFTADKYTTGDDRVLTNYALEMGYKTVYQGTGLVYTEAQKDFISLIKQQIRWARSSQHETFRALGMYLRNKHYFTAFCFLTDIITPLFLTVVVLNMIRRYIEGEFWIEIPFEVAVLMALAGMNISLGARWIRTISIKKNEIPYFMLFILFSTFVMVPVRIYGLITCTKRNTWLTR